jgi:hypothetical protein
MFSAFVRGQPKLIKHPGSLFPDGTPTATFVTLFQMKRFGISPGSLKRVEMSSIVNFHTALQLDWLVRHLPNKSVDELIQYTHSLEYASRILGLSGHKINSISVTGGSPINAIDLGTIEYPKLTDRLQTIRRYGLDLNDIVDSTFDILLEVGPK